MTMSLLLEHFDDLLIAPEDVEYLNRTILTLAVQGKLVFQDAHDEPAIEALKRILKQREEQTLPIIDEGTKIFDLPESWEWTNLGFVSENIHYGYTASADFNSKDYRLLRITDIQDSRVTWESVPGCEITDNDAKKYLLENGDILIARTGGTIGKSFLVADINVKAVFASYLIRVLPSKEILPEYLKVFLDSSLYWKQLIEKSKGTGQPNVNATSLSQLVFGLPPLAEQKRIVARVEELFAQTRALAKELAHSRTELDGLNQSALSHLLASQTPEEFDQHWSFISAHFDLLFQAPEHVTPLRQSILELAVRGKLTRREAGDESALELLKRIREEKAKIGKKETIAPIKDNEKPFDLPSGWEWCRSGDVFLFTTSGSRGWAEYYSTDGAVFLRIGNLDYESIKLDLRNIQKVTPPQSAEGVRTRVQPGDILISITGDVGMTAVVQDGELDEAYINQHIALSRPSKEVLPEFLAYTFISPYGLSQLFKSRKGIKNSLTLTDITSAIIALPPLAEQERIVKRVEHLLALCDALEARLHSAEDQRGLLVAAVMSTVGS